MRRAVVVWFSSVVVLALWIVFPSPSFGVIQPICDVQCGPDPASNGYSGVARARVISRNSRGVSSSTFPVQGGPAGTANNLGSEAYNKGIPILSLPGRNGLDLNLILYYNDRIWEIDPVNRTAVLNADRDFPSYGFRLDFGFLEYNNVDDFYILTEADNTKRKLFNTGSLYNTDDSSYIQLDAVNKIITYTVKTD